MNRFAGSITIGDLMEEFYAKYGRLITGLASLNYTMGLVGMQVVSSKSCYEQTVVFKYYLPWERL